MRTVVRTARGRPVGSTRWLERQLSDPYVARARREGYRARSVYKLAEIDARFRLLRKGHRVVDLGAAPGSWSQYAAQRGCRVVAVDLLPVAPIAGVELVRGDFLDAEVQRAVIGRLGGAAEVVLSDIAAASTGTRAVDRLRAEAIGEAVIAFAEQVLAPGGACLLKLVRGAEAAVQALSKPLFRTVRLLRPAATRADSSEMFVLALDRKRPAEPAA